MNDMSEKIRCKDCGGSGRVMGGGMMMWDCETCDGVGKIRKVDDEVADLEMRQTASYRKAIEEIKNMDSSITEEKAQEIFDRELKLIENEENKNNSETQKKIKSRR
jgi:RecJ-like exonuclease